VVSTHLKNISQNGNHPHNRGENKKYLKQPPRKQHILFNQMRKSNVSLWAARAGNIPGILQELKLTLADDCNQKITFPIEKPKSI